MTVHDRTRLIGWLHPNLSRIEIALELELKHPTFDLESGICDMAPKEIGGLTYMWHWDIKKAGSPSCGNRLGCYCGGIAGINVSAQEYEQLPAWCSMPSLTSSRLFLH